MEELAQFIDRVPVVLSGFLLILGKFLKNSSMKNQWIPIIVVSAGTILNPLIQKAWSDPTAWMIGFMVGATAVGAHQLTIQTKEGVEREVQEHKAEKEERERDIT